jgi:hypothetical protein
MLDRQRVQQAAADEAEKRVDAAALAAERLVDATKEAEETATAAAAAAALSPPEEAQVSLSVLHVKQMRWLRSMLSGIMRQTRM